MLSPYQYEPKERELQKKMDLWTKTRKILLAEYKEKRKDLKL